MSYCKTLFLGAVLTLVGCGTKPAPATGDTPLSMEEWRTMAPHEKLEPDILERLKKANPELQTQHGWQAFYRSATQNTK